MTRLLAADSNYNHHLSDYTLVSYLYVNKKVEKTKHFRRRPRSFFFFGDIVDALVSRLFITFFCMYLTNNESFS